MTFLIYFLYNIYMAFDTLQDKLTKTLRNIEGTVNAEEGVEKGYPPSLLVGM